MKRDHSTHQTNEPIGSYLCDTCGHESETVKQFNLHRNTHICKVHKKQRTYECYICKLQCAGKQRIMSHMLLHVTDVKETFTCDTCGKGYTTLTSLSRHKKSHVEKCPFICTICGKGFRHKNHFNVRISRRFCIY